MRIIKRTTQTGAADTELGGSKMTERSVKRVMLAAAITAAGVLTVLAVGGLLVISRGPQAQALPLVRTLIADSTPAGEAAVAAEVAAADQSTDHPDPAWPTEVGSTTTVAVVAALDESGTVQGTGGVNRTSRRSSSGGGSVDSGPDFPPFSMPPTTAGGTPAATPPTTAGGGTRVSPPTTPTTVKEGDSIKPAEHDIHEVVYPGIRESHDDDDDEDKS